MKAMIKVTLKNGVLDPQGKAIMGSLDALGFEGIDDVRQGKYFEVEIDVGTKAEAEKTATDMCENLLANMVIENFDIEIA